MNREFSNNKEWEITSNEIKTKAEANQIKTNLFKMPCGWSSSGEGLIHSGSRGASFFDKILT